MDPILFRTNDQTLSWCPSGPSQALLKLTQAHPVACLFAWGSTYCFQWHSNVCTEQLIFPLFVSTSHPGLCQNGRLPLWRQATSDHKPVSRGRTRLSQKQLPLILGRTKFNSAMSVEMAVQPAHDLHPIVHSNKASWLVPYLDHATGALLSRRRLCQIETHGCTHTGGVPPMTVAPM